MPEPVYKAGTICCSPLFDCAVLRDGNFYRGSATVRVSRPKQYGTRPLPHEPTLMDLTESNEEMLQGFDLSHLHSLRSLEVTASSLSRPWSSQLFHDIASTITSTAFSVFILVFQRSDLYNSHHTPFDVFRQMYSKRKFRLVFCLEVSKSFRDVGWYVIQRRLDREIGHQRLNSLASRPTLTISERNAWTSWRERGVISRTFKDADKRSICLSTSVALDMRFAGNSTRGSAHPLVRKSALPSSSVDSLSNEVSSNVFTHRS